MGVNELVLIFVALLILAVSRHLPKFAGGLREGIRNFREAADQIGFDTGKSVGGIFGKPAGEALTTENQTEEVRDPVELRDCLPSERGDGKRGGAGIWRWILLVVGMVAAAVLGLILSIRFTG